MAGTRRSADEKKLLTYVARVSVLSLEHGVDERADELIGTVGFAEKWRNRTPQIGKASFEDENRDVEPNSYCGAVLAADTWDSQAYVEQRLDGEPRADDESEETQELEPVPRENPAPPPPREDPVPQPPRQPLLSAPRLDNIAPSNGRLAATRDPRQMVRAMKRAAKGQSGPQINPLPPARVPAIRPVQRHFAPSGAASRNSRQMLRAMDRNQRAQQRQAQKDAQNARNRV